MSDSDLGAAWDRIFENMPGGWYIGPASYDERHDQWTQHTFNPREKLVDGKRTREWIAVGPTELRCLQEMARCLGELREGRWPKHCRKQSRHGGEATRQAAGDIPKCASGTEP